MRGDDVIGIRQDPQTGSLLFLKGEAKSRVKLTAAVVAEAVQASTRTAVYHRPVHCRSSPIG
jgi:hypothetical protein